MRILFLASRLPFPPDRGDRLRTFHFLRQLTTRHDVRLLSFIESEKESVHLEPLQKLGAKVDVLLRRPARSRRQTMLALPTRIPFQVAYYRDRRMRRLVAEASRDRDLVIAHLIRMAPYLDAVSRDARQVVDFCDCISSEYHASLPYRTGWRRFFYGEEAKRVALYERRLLETIDEGWVISEAEIEKFEGDGSRLRVVRNGVSILPEDAERASGSERSRLLFTGNMSVPHNIDAARFLVKAILPRVVEEIPNARVVIAGAAPGPPVRDLVGDHVEVTGRVKDLRDVLRRSDVFVAPMRYVAGVQNKVLEAMSFGLPVVTSELVNRGIGGVADEHLLVAGAPADYAAHVIRLLRDPELAGKVGAAGRRHVRERFFWEAVLERVDAMESEMVGDTRDIAP
jgi:sugar transferase (PEP-CTERM/EpsH1 system associated)